MDASESLKIMKNTLRIISITTHFPPNFTGVGDYTYFLLKELNKRGHQVSVICEDNFGVEYHYDWCKVYPVIKDWTSKGTEECINYLRVLKPDVIILQYAGYAFNKYGIPFYIPVFLKKLKHYAVSVVMFHGIRNKRNKSMKRWINVFFQDIVDRMVYLISDISVTSTRLFKEKIELPFCEKVELIRVGSNIPLYEVEKEELVNLKRQLNIENKLIFGTFGHTPRSLTFIFKAFVELKKVHKLNISLLLLGHFSEESNELTNRLVKKYQLENDIIQTGYLSRREIFIHLNIVDIYLMLEPIKTDQIWTGSSTRSGTLATAMSLGLSIIGTKGEKTDDFFNDKNVYLIEDLSFEEFLISVQQMSIQSIKDGFSEQAKQSFNEHLSWEVIAHQYEKLIFDFLAKNYIEK